MKKAAIIGMGVISSIHLAAIESNPNITLAAVCDTDKSRRSAAPEGLPFYTDYKTMILETKPDVVHICLPHYLHVPVAEEAARMGVHVFCEKPMALNAAEGAEFAEFEAAHPDIHIGICLQNRFNESVEMLKALIEGGEFGAVTGIRGTVPWYREKEYYEVQEEIRSGEWAASPEKKRAVYISNGALPKHPSQIYVRFQEKVPDLIFRNTWQYFFAGWIDEDHFICYNDAGPVLIHLETEHIEAVKKEEDDYDAWGCHYKLKGNQMIAIFSDEEYYRWDIIRENGDIYLESRDNT